MACGALSQECKDINRKSAPNSAFSSENQNLKKRSSNILKTTFQKVISWVAKTEIALLEVVSWRGAELLYLKGKVFHRVPMTDTKMQS